MPELKTLTELMKLGIPWDDSQGNLFDRSQADPKETQKKVWRRDAALAELRRILPELQLKFGVTRIGLFGSVARDKAKPGSDLDLIVHLKTPDLLIMGALLNELEDIFGCKVDLTRWREDFGPVFMAELQRDLAYGD